VRVFLARHGETTWNAEHRLQGRADTQLTERGHEHGRALAALLAATPLDAIYTSTLRRTIDTAAPIAEAQHLLPQERIELVEMSYGALEGRTAADPDPEIRRLWKARKADPVHFRAPGGETYAGLQARLLPFVAELRSRHANGTVLVIGHRATNRVLRALLLGLPLADSLAYKAKHDCVLEIRSGMDPEWIEHRYSAVEERRSST